MRTSSLQILILGGALLVGAGCNNAPERSAAAADPTPAPAPANHAQLEAIFWACDYVATTRGVDATPIRECAAATRELRRVKFAGSFQAMLAWWQQNKTAEHRRLQRERGEQPL